MSRQQGTGEWTGPQWEYKMVPIGYLQANQERTLNELGREGWALIGAPPNLPLIFKRPVRGSDEKPPEPKYRPSTRQQH